MDKKEFIRQKLFAKELREAYQKYGNIVSILTTGTGADRRATVAFNYINEKYNFDIIPKINNVKLEFYRDEY
jgi:hypothetical protein